MNRKVLILGPTLPSVGGITTAVNTLMNSCLPEEFEICLMANSNHRPMNRKGIIDARNIFSFLEIFVRLIWTILSYKPRVVQVEMAGGISFLKQSVYVLAAGIMGCKLIASLHCANDDEPLVEFASNSRVVRLYVGWVLRICHTVKVLSPRWTEDFSTRWSLNPNKVVAVQNCLERQFPWDAGLSRQSSDGKFVIVCVGSVGVRKGSFLLIEAIARLRNAGIPAELVLVGSEERAGVMDDLIEAVQKFGVAGAIHLLGELPRERVLEQVAMANLFALPSYAEGMPYSIIEAMAIGVAVVASNVGAINNIIIDESTGLIVQAGCIDQLEKALLRLARDANLRQTLALKGNEFAHNHFGIHHLESTLRTVYERLLGTRRVEHDKPTGTLDTVTQNNK